MIHNSTKVQLIVKVMLVFCDFRHSSQCPHGTISVKIRTSEDKSRGIQIGRFIWSPLFPQNIFLSVFDNCNNQDLESGSRRRRITLITEREMSFLYIYKEGKSVGWLVGLVSSRLLSFLWADLAETLLEGQVGHGY